MKKSLFNNFKIIILIFFCLLVIRISWAIDDPSSSNEITDETRLLFYAHNGNLAETESLLKKGVSADSRDPSEYNEGETPLMQACVNGDMGMVRLLVKYGADINAVDKRGESVLLQAAYVGNFEAVKYLVEKGADVNLKSKKGYSPVLVSADKGYESQLKYLVEKGGSVLDKSKDGVTTVMAASKYHPELLEYLISNEVDVNARTSYGGTALMIAVRSGQGESVEILLKHGALLNYKTKKGYDVFWFAVNSFGRYLNKENSEVDIYSYLIEKCLDEKECTSKNSSLLFSVISMIVDKDYMPEKKIRDRIYSREEILKARDKEGYTPLDVALFWRKNNNLKILSTELEKNGMRKTIPENFIEINKMVSEGNFNKLELIFKEVNWKKYFHYQDNSLRYSRTAYSNVEKLYNEFARKNFWIPEIGENYDTLEIYCKKNNLKPFDYLFLKLLENDQSGYEAKYRFNRFTGALLNRCGAVFTSAYLSRKMKTTEKKKFQKFLIMVYNYLKENLASDRWGYNQSGFRGLLRFLAQSGFQSRENALTKDAIAMGRTSLIDLIKEIEPKKDTIDENGNSVYHYIFSVKSENYPYPIKIDIGTPNKKFSIKHYRIFNELLKSYDKVDIQNDIGVTPLMLACRFGKYYIVRELVKRGADIELKDKSGLSAIDYALLSRETSILGLFNSDALNKHESILENFLSAWASENPEKNPKGDRSERYLAYLLNPAGTMKDFIKAAMIEEDCIMFEDVEKGNEKGIEYWLNKGYSPLCRNGWGVWRGYNAMELAIYNKNFKILELFARKTNLDIEKNISEYNWENLPEIIREEIKEIELKRKQ